MELNKLKALISIGVLTSVVGFIVLFFSVNFGTNRADNWLTNKGGIADTSTYEIMMKGYINIFLIAGGIFLAFGLFTTLFTYYKLLQMKD